ncbi:hypothetical protein ACF1FC_30935 [Streptomyces sp. NPDC014344]|uniref:hypothetical protein n=1 Tax=Streptomyces sp. NPDC014344 TaxID=3364871 RepID=UPI0034610336
MGLVVTFVAGTRLYRAAYKGSGKRSDLVILAAGVWLTASPFVLGLGDTAVSEAKVFDIATGIVLMALAFASLVMLRAAHKPPAAHRET